MLDNVLIFAYRIPMATFEKKMIIISVNNVGFF